MPAREAKSHDYRTSGWPPVLGAGRENGWLRATPQMLRNGLAHPKVHLPSTKLSEVRLSPGLSAASPSRARTEGSIRTSVLNLHSTQPVPFGRWLMLTHRLKAEAQAPSSRVVAGYPFQSFLSCHYNLLRGPVSSPSRRCGPVGWFKSNRANGSVPLRTLDCPARLTPSS
jgi:hypothetical protein